MTEEPLRQPADFSNDALLARVAEVVGDITADKVGAVLAAYWAIHEGDPIGMVRRDPETGAIAHRTEESGVGIWRVSLPNGETYNDMQPSLPWPEVTFQ